MKIYLIRHGETIENLRKTVMGHLPGRLSRGGKFRAKKLALFLKNHHFDAIYSSDLKRAVDTAKEVARHHPHQVIYTDHLRETNFGNLQGKSWSHINAAFAKSPISLMAQKARGGESLTDLKNRVRKFIKYLSTKHPRDTVLVVTHNAVIKMFLSIFRKIHPSKLFSSPFSLPAIPSTSVFVITITKKRATIREIRTEI